MTFATIFSTTPKKTKMTSIVPLNRLIAVDSKRTNSYQNNSPISVTIICKKVMPCLIRITIKSAVNYCCRIIRLNLKMIVSAQEPVYRRGAMAMAPHLGCQGSIISIEWYAKVWHAPFFVSLAPCLSTQTDRIWLKIFSCVWSSPDFKFWA